MIEHKNFKNILKPFTLARLILGGTAIAVGGYYFVCSNSENFYSMSYLLFIQQLLGSFLLLLNGCEELRKPEGKKLHGYAYFAVAAFITIMVIWAYPSQTMH